MGSKTNQSSLIHQPYDLYLSFETQIWLGLIPYSTTNLTVSSVLRSFSLPTKEN